MQMSGRKNATAGMAIGGGLNSNSGGELKLYLDWKRNTNPNDNDVILLLSQ